MKKDEVKLSDYFYYDETSPTFLRWKVEIRTGNKGVRVLVSKGDVAGSETNNGYYEVELQGKSRRVHRVIWEIENGPIPKGMEVDHEDGIRHNNRLGNLRLVAKVINRRNNCKRDDNTSTVTGVCKSTHNGKSCWIAQWTEDGKRRSRSVDIHTHGENEAFRLACEFRSQALARINAAGAGYTERHGK